MGDKTANRRSARPVDAPSIAHWLRFGPGHPGETRPEFGVPT
ncbi:MULTISPECIES: hypothetical protein [unclassified Marinovum]